MSLSPGTKLGSYEILSPLGAGGMGEVYLARDGKLDRQVAIKVLPESMTRDPERVARFERLGDLLGYVEGIFDHNGSVLQVASERFTLDIFDNKESSSI